MCVVILFNYIMLLHFWLMVGGPPTLQTMSVTRFAQRNDFQFLNKHTSSVSTAAAALSFENLDKTMFCFM